MRGPGKLFSKGTGGSTGMPLQFDLNPDSNDRRVAASIRGYGWAGVETGCKQLYLWGVAVTEQSRKQRWKDALYHGIYRRKFLSTFNLSEERFSEYLEFHNRYRPDAVVAYTNSLHEFARMLADKKAQVHSPKSIVVGAEKLHPFQRELIEKVFGAPVFETYGSREFMLMGSECERHCGLHLTQEYLLVEVVDEDGQPTPAGEEGNVVVTDLYNYGMPFVRYKNGDRAIAGFEQCGCGRGLPLLKQVTGRVVDFVQTPDGRRITGLFFPHLLKDFAGVGRFQVVQDAPDHVQIRIVATPKWNDGERRAVDGIVRSHLGPAVKLDIVNVDEIPLTGAGKQRVVVNSCA
jgi:phenylacetate-CoA ligase